MCDISVTVHKCHSVSICTHMLLFSFIVTESHQVATSAIHYLLTGQFISVMAPLCNHLCVHTHHFTDYCIYKTPSVTFVASQTFALNGGK